MNKGTRGKVIAVLVAIFAFVFVLQPAYGSYDATGGYVTLLGHNGGNAGESTFMTNIVRSNYGWSDMRDPHQGTNYYCGSYQLCTPKVTNGEFKFPGDSLVIGHRLVVHATSTLEIDDFRLEKNGYIMAMAENGYSATLRGNLTILGNRSSPSGFSSGQNPQHFKVEAALKGDSEAFAYSALTVSGTTKPFISFDTQYVELDDADEYYGTFEVRTNSCLKLASNLPGTVTVANGGCLMPIASVTLGTLSLADGATLGFVNGGTITVTEGFSASDKIKVASFGGPCYTQALLEVPVGVGTLDVDSFAGDGVRLTVVTTDATQTLYAENLEPSVFDATTGFVTQNQGSTASPDANAFDRADYWSDGRTPHSDTNYYSAKGIFITTNSTFAGRSLTIERTNIRVNGGVTVTVPDLRVKGGNSASSGTFTTSGSAGTFYLGGTMTVLSKLTDAWPFAFWGANSPDAQRWISSQKIIGDDTRAFELRGNTGKATGEASGFVEFRGDLSMYHGTIIVGTNYTARLGGSAMPGTIRLDTPSSHVDTMAADGAEVKIGKLTSRISTSFSVAATNTLIVTDAISLSGTLTKNGAGMLVVGGIAVPGASAALVVNSGSIRVDSAHALDGIPIAFVDGTKYIRDYAAEDASLVQYGLYNTAEVMASGTMNVEISNLPIRPMPGEVALFTVPASCAGALASSIRFSPRPKGYAIDTVVADSESELKTIKAVLHVAGLAIIVR